METTYPQIDLLKSIAQPRIINPKMPKGYKTIFGNAIFVSKLGEGGYGQVGKYVLPDGKIIAIKNVNPSDDGISPSTLREIHALEVTKGCSNILQLIDIKSKIERGETIINMMLTYHTGDLKKFYKSVPTLERVKYSGLIIKQLLNGLRHLYDRGIIHRDIKPDNILIDYDYSSETTQLTKSPICYIGDFGLARQLPCTTNRRTDNMTIEVYTSVYRPPEILLGNANYTDKADLWALGITMVEYFTKRPLFINQETESNIIFQIFNELTLQLQNRENNINLAKNGTLHDHIDVDRHLHNNLNQFHHNSIPTETISLLSNMLQFHPDDRLHITQLVTSDGSCPFKNNILLRGNIHTQSSITAREYYILVIWILNLAIMFKLKIRTIVASIDMIDRYLSNYPVSRDNLQLIAFCCIMIVSKINEIFSPEINDYIFVSDNSVSSDQLKETELIVFERMNNILISCDIDDYVHRLELIDITLQSISIYDYITKIYFTMKKRGLYPGSLPYTQIISYLY